MQTHDRRSFGNDALGMPTSVNKQCLVRPASEHQRREWEIQQPVAGVRVRTRKQRSNPRDFSSRPEPAVTPSTKRQQEQPLGDLQTICACIVPSKPTNLVIVIEDEGLVVDEDAVEQKPDGEEDDGHGPHSPERRHHVLAVPRPESDEAQHDDPEDEKLVLRLDGHVCVHAPRQCSASCVCSVGDFPTSEGGIFCGSKKGGYVTNEVLSFMLAPLLPQATDLTGQIARVSWLSGMLSAEVVES